MTFVQILILAAVQGLTEFLPVSSSAHLVLVPYLTGWTDQGQSFDIACHVGTLLAVLFYFRRDVAMIIEETLRYPAHQEFTLGVRLFFYIAIGTIPAVIFGFTLKQIFPEGIRSIDIIIFNLMFFAVVMHFADRFSLAFKKVDHLNWLHALMIGCAQALALIPGVSRSGITISAARFLGIDRAEAARYSMLLSIPAILGAALLAYLDFDAALNSTAPMEFLLGVGFSFGVGVLAISFLMRWLQTSSLQIFVVYRLALGALLAAWVYF